VPKLISEIEAKRSSLTLIMAFQAACITAAASTAKKTVVLTRVVQGVA
jgi:hypothetical protein